VRMVLRMFVLRGTDFAISRYPVPPDGDVLGIHTYGGKKSIDVNVGTHLAR